jgi:hypothetical protein
VSLLGPEGVVKNSNRVAITDNPSKTIEKKEKHYKKIKLKRKRK